MNARWISPLALMASILVSHGQDDKTAPNVHEFRSKSGSTMKAVVIGTDADGNVLLQPYAAPRAVPLESLRPEDQEYVKAEQARLTQEAEFIRQGWLDLHYADPGISLLKDSLRLLNKDGKWEPYEPRDITKLRYVAYYFNKEFPDDRFISQLSSAYKRLRKRSPLVEVVYVSINDSAIGVPDYVKSKKFEFPVFDPRLRGRLDSNVVGKQVRVYPQLVVMDRQGQVLANSFKGVNEKSDYNTALETLEKLVREASRASTE